MGKFQSCDPSKDSNLCPTGSSVSFSFHYSKLINTSYPTQCVDNGTAASYCVCSSNFTVNEEYKSGKEYCVRKNETISTPDNSATDTTTQVDKTEPTAKAQTTSTPEKAVTKAPELLTTSKAVPSTEKPSPKTPKPDVKKPDESTEPPKIAVIDAPKATDDIKIAPAPTHHHILGGIFIPTFLVLGFICGAFAIKKYSLIEKARELIRNRNHQQRYNGLMENEFDDDDPLLI